MILGAEYAGALPTFQEFLRDLNAAARRAYGCSLRAMPQLPPEIFGPAWLVLRDAIRPQWAAAPAWFRRFGLKRWTSALFVSPPYELAHVLLAVKHGRSPVTIARDLTRKT